MAIPEIWKSGYLRDMIINLKYLSLYGIQHLQCFQCMITSSNGNIFRVTGPLCGEFTGPGEFPTQRPVTRSFDVYFDLRPNKRLCKQSWGWWFQTLLCPLWRHSIGIGYWQSKTAWKPSINPLPTGSYGCKFLYRYFGFTPTPLSFWHPVCSLIWYSETTCYKEYQRACKFSIGPYV